MLIQQITNYPVQSLDAGAVLEWDDAEACRMIEANLVVAWAPEPAAPVQQTARKPKRETRGS